METPESPLVSVEWLRSHMDDPNIIVADCRYDLFDHDLGAREYGQGHIPGAYFLHMEKELISPVKEHGGRHPIPDENSFTDSMNRIGLTNESLVVAYDNDGSGAARLWWLLNYYGHENVKILNGGYPHWVDSGYPVSTEVPENRTGNFVPSINKEILCTVDELKDLGNESKIVDSRTWERYIGKVEPIDFKAGHIPGAINIPYMDAIRDRAIFRDRNELETIYDKAGNQPVFYCGSGITSCVSFVASRIIGKNPRLYAGSFSDWISYPENEVATGEIP